MRVVEEVLIGLFFKAPNSAPCFFPGVLCFYQALLVEFVLLVELRDSERFHNGLGVAPFPGVQIIDAPARSVVKGAEGQRSGP